MLNHVLIPLDGSVLAETALTAAKHILGVNANITLVTAVDMPQTPVYGFDMPTAMAAASREGVEEAIQHGRRYLEQIAADLRTKGYQVHVVVNVGDAAAVIAETAERHHVEAIVICTHGRSGISRWLFGSVTNKVLSTTQCPLYIIPSLKKAEATETAVKLASAVS